MGCREIGGRCVVGGGAGGFPAVRVLDGDRRLVGVLSWGVHGGAGRVRGGQCGGGVGWVGWIGGACFGAGGLIRAGAGGAWAAGEVWGGFPCRGVCRWR